MKAALLSASDAPEGLDIAHFFGGHAYVKESRVRAGMALAQHMHTYDHLSYLVQGTVVVEVDGEREILTAPRCFTIHAGKHHGIRAVTDTVWLCIHGTEETDPAKVDMTLIDPASSDAQMLRIAEGLA